MAVLSRDDMLNAIKSRIGDDTSDEALALIENFTDTYDDMSNRVSEAGDWKTKFEQNDAEWRNKYKERFFSGGNPDEHDPDPEPEPVSPKTFDDLFRTKE